MERVLLNVLGLSYSNNHTGSYALILGEENGEYRIPIIIGVAEAQAIAIALEGMPSGRPLTHDLFYNFANIFSIKLKEVEIYKIEEGIFYSILVFFDGKSTVRIDARTSDAVALAIRFKAPIYTTKEIIEKAGINIDKQEENEKKQQQKDTEETDDNQGNIEKKSIGELQEMLNKAIKEENYELASVIRDEINKRKKS
jgi:bifunctional DNase/RNase